jgi:error-prone DNA polymerase
MLYTELHCLTNFSFQRGASHADELVKQAVALDYAGLAITDECSFAGSARAHLACKELTDAGLVDPGFRLIHGTEIQLADGPKILLLACHHAGYTRLCQLITQGRMAANKGHYHLTRADLETLPPDDCLAIYIPPRPVPDPDIRLDELAWMHDLCSPESLWIAVELHRGQDDARHLADLRALAAASGIPLVAAGDVHMHKRNRRALQDVMTALRSGKTVATAGTDLFPNGERYLRSRQRLAAIYPTDLLEQTALLAQRCEFSLSELAYEYPYELVPEGVEPEDHLRRRTEAGAAWRWPQGEPPKVREQIERELALIHEMGYEHYFLTVHDIVAFARSQHILCQGRGSAANSAVCYCLGITEVDPSKRDMLFERFISRERNEPPDIDVDFEHERREEVIQYIYRKYGRDRAALAATVISYRPRSAIRDVGKALGFGADAIDALAKSLSWWESMEDLKNRLMEAGFDPAEQRIGQLMRLVHEILGFPRHLSQHVGGFVLSEKPLHHLVPVENASMADRSIIQWDKDDLEALGLLKVDVLALGMLSCIRRCFDLIAGFRGKRHNMASLPAGDTATYDMICAADTIGVFQIESRAQMSMLPRLRPRKFFDLVIEVAIVRPGPIQGGMVHPYLRRRQGLDPVTYPSDALKEVLERTLGVPLFQEQVMQIAMVAAGYTAGEADKLRRDMAAWKRKGGLEPHREKITQGMLERGYDTDFADRIFEQIKGFGSYGFPESHAVSFALLVYVSCWLKCHEPAAFAVALINSQPMGFYAPAQIIADARRHNVEVRPADVQQSAWDCTLESRPDREPAIRLGLRLVKGLAEDAGHRIIAARAQAVFASMDDLIHRAALDRHARKALSRADALRSLAGHRHRAHWQTAGAEILPGLLAGTAARETDLPLPAPSEAQDVLADYASTGLTLRRHPLALLRPMLRKKGALTTTEYEQQPHNSPVTVAGLVTTRQRPGTAKGVIFLTLEDETGPLNVIVWKDIYQQYRREILGGKLLLIKGKIQRAGEVRHCIALQVEDGSAWVGQLETASRDFH